MGRIGVVGGSGLYHIEGLKVKETRKINTPFGDPSSEYVIGTLDGKEVVFLPRHDKAHRISPTHINYRANIYGMKKLDVEWLISVSACGSLKEEIKPLDFVIPLQFVDRTTQARKYTFFDSGIVAHIGFAHPVCENLANLLYNVVKEKKLDVHFGGTYINMEGPQFSTLSESNLYRSWGMDIIGMTNMTEARLAREAEICYATLAAVTDYDCWHQTEETVSVEGILENLTRNVENAKSILKDAITRIDERRSCACKDALKHAILTDHKVIPRDVKKKLDILIGKYVK
ncbi:MAG: S-methyl-5'-thioadenosine phosphorylase [Candidatus Omnitrophica bacterium]|nr:S-methyl-5'-thioadenosine phosphorylase [Candidatus Omnitrophota bacterium]